MRQKFDFEQIENFGKVNLPLDDIAILLNLPLHVIQKLMTPGKKFYAHYRRGQAITRYDILQTQLAVAMGATKSNPTMLSHLGAVLLGQNPDAKPIEQDEHTEALLQSIPSKTRKKLFDSMMGFIPSDTTVVDDGTDP
jgi:hypothetical protein